MYIWVGIDVDGQLRALRERAEAIDRRLGFKHSCFTLPLHISLKISFAIENRIFEEVVEEITRFYDTLHSFELRVKGIEKEKGIVWIRYEEEAYISSVKDKLNEVLAEKFLIGRHEYDLDYIFHTTLFMDGDEEKLAAAFDGVRNTDLSQSVVADKFIIGKSETGALGTFSVFKEINRRA